MPELSADTAMWTVMNCRAFTTPIAAAAVFLFGSAVACRAADDFYVGKTITIAVGSSVGGGIDYYGRILARHIGKHIPGRPSVITQNILGASGMKSVQYVENIAPHDGTVMVTFNASLIGSTLTEPDKVPLDFTKMRFVGNATSEVWACYVWHTVGPKTFDEVIAAREIIFGSTGQTAGNYFQGAMLRNIFGAKIRHVLGYPGSAELVVAIERGELHGDCVTWNSIPPDLISSGKVVPFVRFSQATAPNLPPVPYILDKARNEEERQIINMVTIFSDVARPFVAGSKVSPERLAILREAFNRTVKDLDFIAEAAKARRDIIDPMTGEEVEKKIAEFYATPKAVVAKFANAVK
jgi:tripartite-type tricarboxylate transporter receptor subunit TctC